MSVTGFAATPVEFDDEMRHIVAPPACSEHHLHHHHHRMDQIMEHGLHEHQTNGRSVVGSEKERNTEDDDGELVITATQKMLSACSGSLLTSLLGKFLSV